MERTKGLYSKSRNAAKRVLAFGLTLAMVFSSGTWMGLGKVAADAATTEPVWEDTGLVTDGGFEDGDNCQQNWAPTVAVWEADSEKSVLWANTGDNPGVLNIYNANSDVNAMSVSQTIIDVPAGKYKVSVKISGGGSDTGLKLSAYNGDTEVVSGAAISGNVGTVIETKDFALTETTNLTIKMAGDVPAKYWGTLDDVVLSRLSDGTSDPTPDEKSYSISYYSEDYSTTDNVSDWTAKWTTTDCSVTNKVKDSSWNTWSEKENGATFSKTFTNLPAGEYTMSFVAVGDKMGGCKVALTDGSNAENTVSNDMTINAWGGSAVTKTDALTLSAEGSVTVEFACTYNADGWLNFDDLVLAKNATYAEKKAYDADQLRQQVVACAEYEEAAYTEDSWAVLQTAITAANAVITDLDNATLEQIAQASADLKAAIGNLKVGAIFVKKVENLSKDFIRGVDISSYVSVTESGATFKDAEGNVLDDAGFFQLLKDSGVNYVRIRVWNDPYDADGHGYGGGNNDLEKAKTIGKLATDAGMGVLIDFHYSDFWADPERQYVPKAWGTSEEVDGEDKDGNPVKYKSWVVNKTADEMAALVYDYTKTSLTELKNAGVNVGMVQVGNETNNGIAGINRDGGWKDMCKLFSAGSRAIRDVDSSIQVALHFTDPQTAGFYDTVTKELDENNVDYDVFASSYYPNIHGSMANLTNVLNKVAATYNKKVMVAETSWAWTTADGDGHGQSFDPGSNGDYSISVQGQAMVVRDVVEAVNNVENNAGIGVFYWEPAWLAAEYAYDENGKKIDSIYKSNQEKWEKDGSGWASSYSDEYDHKNGGLWFGGSVKDNEAFFDFEGYPLKSLTIFNDIYTGVEGSMIKLEKIKHGAVEVLLNNPDIAAEYDTIQAQLPKTVEAIFNNSERVDIPVIWNTDEINFTEFGNYTINGYASGTYQGKSYEGATQCEIVVLPDSILTNGDFEDGKNSWTVSNADDVDLKWNDTPIRGEGAMHFWSSKDMNFTLTQTVTAAKAGKYCASMQLQGNDGSDSDEISIEVVNETKGTSKKANALLKGWKVWQNPRTETVDASAGDQLTVTITIKSIANAWGSVDDVFLYSIGAYTGGSTSGGTSSSTTTTPTPDTSTQTKPDGTVVTKTETTGADGSKTVVVTETATDGSKVETKTETAADGTVKTTVTKTAVDGSTAQTVNETEKNAAGNDVAVTTTTKADAEGKIVSVTEKSVIENITAGTDATVIVKKDGEGVVSAKASVTKVANGSKAVLHGTVIDQLQDAAGQKDLTITMVVRDTKGNTKYIVKADAADLTADEKLCVYQLNTKTGEYVMVNAKTYKVSGKGSVSISLSKKATYTLVTKADAAVIDRQILKTVAPKKSVAVVKKGKATTLTFSSKLNRNNVKSITYASSKKSVATVSKSGKITAKKAGTVIVKAKVTLKNGATKTVRMKVKVK